VGATTTMMLVYESAILMGLVWHLFCLFYVDVVGDGVEPMDNIRSITMVGSQIREGN
jgi:hypothetical protein